MSTTTAAQRAAIARRPKLRPPTRRMIGAAHWFHDRRRRRYVVFRQAGGVRRKTSVRYSIKVPGSMEAAVIRSRRIARALSACPAHLLRSFEWPA